MRKLNLFTIVFVFSLTIFLIPFINSRKADALSGSDFKPGRIIDDFVFTNKNSMSPAQIQDFLNAKMPVCEIWHSAYNASNPPPYTCLKDYQENTTTSENNFGRFVGNTPYQVPGGKSAAQIIWDASQAYNINPQVLIVTLQKEQALITDTWPLLSQFTKALGWNCDDSGGTATCGTSFYQQVMTGAWQYRNDLNGIDTPNFSSPHGKGWNNIAYKDNNPSCGYRTVYIENQATAVLYKYTPYTPNDAALAVMNDNTPGGVVNCGAYGNRNFFWYFTKWFGSTTGPNYSWEIVSWSYAGGDNVIGLNQTERVVLKAKNVGRNPWYNHGANPVRLGTWDNPGRLSTLLGQNVNKTRFATLTESVVLPYETGTFEFDIIPTQIGTVVEAMNIVSENNEWAAWPGFSPTIRVSNSYDWKIDDIIYNNGTGLMEPGKTQLITLKAKNTGTTTWSKITGPKIRLATWQPGRESKVSGTWLSSTRVAEMNETTVAPGAVAGFQFFVTMPSSGNFYESLNLVAEGVSWFNDQNTTLYLEGKSYKWEPVWTSPSTSTYRIPKNTELTLTIRVKNTGTMTWSKTSSYPVRIGTAGPLNRGSAFETATWLNSIRPGALLDDTVLPGQEGTFSFKVKTPNTTGTRVERFNLVAEGVSWFNDPGYQVTFDLY